MPPGTALGLLPRFASRSRHRRWFPRWRRPAEPPSSNRASAAWSPSNRSPWPIRKLVLLPSVARFGCTDPLLSVGHASDAAALELQRRARGGTVPVNIAQGEHRASLESAHRGGGEAHCLAVPKQCGSRKRQLAVDYQTAQKSVDVAAVG